ncbi:Extracellular metalloproteinase [Mycena sanguinolenta]|uniref:Extracellular metalloproteinase n=1 Tax=Mycena sanguinolenta TaxID=230812 RepID=A0A8H7CEP5_9AGAR|nr:Extracellular metalloproteinase [Mycena sanguinolenta]
MSPSQFSTADVSKTSPTPSNINYVRRLGLDDIDGSDPIFETIPGRGTNVASPVPTVFLADAITAAEQALDGTFNGHPPTLEFLALEDGSLASHTYGFTEAAFNLQNNNFGNGGLGNDRVTISVQNSAGVDNADFSTPPEFIFIPVS